MRRDDNSLHIGEDFVHRKIKQQKNWKKLIRFHRCYIHQLLYAARVGSVTPTISPSPPPHLHNIIRVRTTKIYCLTLLIPTLSTSAVGTRVDVKQSVSEKYSSKAV